MRWPVVALSAFLVCLCGCPDDGGGTDETEETGGEPGARLTFTHDAADLCVGGVTEVELVTRKRDCFDPPVPCTVPADPQWVQGTTLACADLSGEATWSVTVQQTGRWETQLRGVGAETEGFCVALASLIWTPVALADIESNTELALMANVAPEDCDPEP